MKQLFYMLTVFMMGVVFAGCSTIDVIMDDILEPNTGQESTQQDIEEDGHYTSKDEVALYLYHYGRLPDNFITKQEAADLGWEASEGNLWEVTSHKSIGGDRFGNREGNLPDQEGRQYYEADINYEGGYRGAERIVYSNDGLIYYTADHYDTFTLLYGEE